MQAPNILCNIPILFAVSQVISRGSRFPAISSDSRINFAVLPKQIFLELASPPPRRTGLSSSRSHINATLGLRSSILGLRSSFWRLPAHKIQSVLIDKMKRSPELLLSGLPEEIFRHRRAFLETPEKPFAKWYGKCCF